MSTDSMFETEDDDIVRLVPGEGSANRHGWINVGVHVVEVTVDDDGNLLIQTYARSVEDRILGTLEVSHQDAVNAGGVDPDIDDSEVDDPNGEHLSSPRM